MPGKLTTILAKNEAEVYCAHGLLQDALRLYKNLLAKSPKLDIAYKRSIENQIDAIQKQIARKHPDEQACLSADDILRLKQGWGSEATNEDLMVCARAFYQIGHFRSAMSELAKLMENGCAMQEVAGLFADCLVGLNRPQQLLATIQRTVGKVMPRPENLYVFVLVLTEKMVARKQLAHALVLYRSIKSNSLLKTKAAQRLDAIARGIQSLGKAGIEP